MLLLNYFMIGDRLSHIVS